MGNFPLFGGPRGDFLDVVDWPQGRSTAGIVFDAWMISADRTTSLRVYQDHPPFRGDDGAVRATTDPSRLTIELASLESATSRLAAVYALRNTSSAPIFFCELAEHHVTLSRHGSVVFTLGASFPRSHREGDAEHAEHPDCSRHLQMIPAGGDAFRTGMYCGDAQPGDVVDAELRYWIASPLDRRLDG